MAGALIRGQLGRSCGKTLGGALMAGKSVCSEHRGYRAVNIHTHNRRFHVTMSMCVGWKRHRETHGTDMRPMDLKPRGAHW